MDRSLVCPERPGKLGVAGYEQVNHGSGEPDLFSCPCAVVTSLSWLTLAQYLTLWNEAHSMCQWLMICCWLLQNLVLVSLNSSEHFR